MKTTEEMIAVMQAYADGKEIEVKHYNDNSSWYPCLAPKWNWRACDYRIKPAPPQKKIVPYENAEEFLQAQQEHGPYININGERMMPICFDNEGVTFYAWGKSYSSVKKRFLYYEFHYCSCLWQDGTPVGKEAEA